MKLRPANTLEPANLRDLLRHVGRQRYPYRNRVIVLLSFKAGLRACEIAGLEGPMVLGSHNRVSDQLTISRSISKMGSGQLIPLHKELKHALVRLHAVEGPQPPAP